MEKKKKKRKNYLQSAQYENSNDLSKSSQCIWLVSYMAKMCLRPVTLSTWKLKQHKNKQKQTNKNINKLFLKNQKVFTAPWESETIYNFF